MASAKPIQSTITYPYLPTGGFILYVPEENPYMHAAKLWAREHTTDGEQPIGTLIVRNGEILGYGFRHSPYHEKNGCERVRLHIPTGQGYELCEGCSPKNHSEPRAIQDALQKNTDLAGAAIYLWGHWWCCESCWDTMLAQGISTVYLLKGSEKLFNKTHPDNIVGK